MGSKFIRARATTVNPLKDKLDRLALSIADSMIEGGKALPEEVNLESAIDAMKALTNYYAVSERWNPQDEETGGGFSDIKSDLNSGGGAGGPGTGTPEPGSPAAPTAADNGGKPKGVILQLRKRDPEARPKDLHPQPED